MMKFLKKKVKVICPVYAGQKNQKRNLTKLPVGSIGTTTTLETNEYNINYYVVWFQVDNQKFWAKLSETTFQFLD